MLCRVLSCDEKRQIRAISRAQPGLHLVVDNCATHSHPEVQKWLARQPRLVMHFTPTNASWLNMVERMVERFIRDSADKPLHRDSCASVPELEWAIDAQPAGS